MLQRLLFIASRLTAGKRKLRLAAFGVENLKRGNYAICPGVVGIKQDLYAWREFASLEAGCAAAHLEGRPVARENSRRLARQQVAIPVVKH